MKPERRVSHHLGLSALSCRSIVRMKYLMIFLVLSLVVFMAEPGEGFFRHLKAIFKGARRGWREYRDNKNLRNAASQSVQQDDDSQPPYDERW
ncbi:unnamed protein product [Pleuronectes platessa]|uniref:Uncharacterized protein n=1 Tax=Pleuronectes platessa TaxID=8262 RepID=A0A9N7Y4K1_PLEPL|nr:unnamed protein product [Pleuronectes platessa]